MNNWEYKLIKRAGKMGWAIQAADKPEMGWCELHVTKLPGRKRYALCLKYGNIIDPVAYFRDEKSAGRVRGFLNILGQAKNVPDEGQK